MRVLVLELQGIPRLGLCWDVVWVRDGWIESSIWNLNRCPLSNGCISKVAYWAHKSGIKSNYELCRVKHRALNRPDHEVEGTARRIEVRKVIGSNFEGVSVLNVNIDSFRVVEAFRRSQREHSKDVRVVRVVCCPEWCQAIDVDSSHTDSWVAHIVQVF